MKRSKHDLSHYELFSGKMGYLYPCGLTEVLPGDTLQHATSCLIRAMPLKTPPMHNVRARIHHWFVPHRLVMEDFQDFITGGPDNDDDTEFPTIALNNVALRSLADYLGVPVGFTGSVSALPFRALALIWNENYRDQDLQPLAGFSKASGVDVTTSTSLQAVCWEKDYFTTARPWEQKGPAITMPIGVSAPVAWSGATPVNLTIQNASTGGAHVMTAGGTYVASTATGGSADDALYADLQNATGVDVTDVRRYFSLQRFAEARARYGSRYTEYLAYLGVRSSDARLQRPEYLGGGKHSLQFSEVLQTASTTADGDGVGQLYGHGITGLHTRRYRRFFEEHGYVVSVAYVMPQSIYPQGIPRHWNYRVKEDFWQKELEHIGQQPILMKELYALGAGPETVFGYGGRYAQYRSQFSQLHGEFRTVLDDWHFGRILAAQPTLNASFVAGPVAARPFQAQGDNDTLLFAANHQKVARRLVSGSDASYIF